MGARRRDSKTLPWVICPHQKVLFPKGVPCAVLGDFYQEGPTEEYLREMIKNWMSMPVERFDTYTDIVEAGMMLQKAGRCQPSLRKEIERFKEFLDRNAPLSRENREQAPFICENLGLDLDSHNELSEPNKEEIAELVVNRWASGSHCRHGLLQKVSINLPFTPDVPPANGLWKVGNRQLHKGRHFQKKCLSGSQVELKKA